MASQQEIDAMRWAIAISAHGQGSTSPNPPVGCVILDKSGDVAGLGFHQRKGESHAEVRALDVAAQRAERGTAIVTLEPCNHVGRTPACRQALLEAGIARVVIALLDPTSRGEGGAAVLRTSGVSVEVGVLADEARLVLGPWMQVPAVSKPQVVAAWAYDSTYRRIPDEDAVDDLRGQADVVLREDGHVAEAIAGRHNRQTLTLPAEPLAGEPAELLRLLYEAGARTVILEGSEAFVSRFADEDLLDRVIVSLHRPELTSIPPLNATFGSTRLRISAVANTGERLRIELTRPAL